MPAKDLGQKHLCWKCGTKFYDLKKPAPLCPKCGSDARQAPARKAPPPEKKPRAPAREEREEAPADEAGADVALEEPADDEVEDADDE
jgi:uncharacterized protein (TIGR02300 family)